MRKWVHPVTSEEAGKTLECVLRNAGFTKKEISRQKFLPRGITVDGVKCRVNTIVLEGQQVVLELGFGEKWDGIQPPAAANLLSGRSCVPVPEEQADMPDASPLKVCYEDEDVLVLDKPSGLSCHPGRGHYQDNLGSRAVSYCRNKGENMVIRQVGRLDRDTSGLVVFGKNQEAAARLWRQKEKGIFYKVYTAAVHGRFEKKSGEIAFSMEKIPEEKNRMRVTGLKSGNAGMTAVTNYRVLDETLWNGKVISVMECTLLTGRTHQIRVHMASVGHPVVGDVFYGCQDGGKRLFLHAGKVCFCQPFTGEKIEISVFPDWEVTQ